MSEAMNCQEFVTQVNVCSATEVRRGGLDVICNDQHRVTRISALPSLSYTKGGRCTLTWRGKLSSTLELLDDLQDLVLAVPSREVYFDSLDATLNYGTLKETWGCETVAWQGGNLTGKIPEALGQLRLRTADLRGNHNLTGRVPLGWMAITGYVHIAETGLHQDSTCSLNCQTLESPTQRDRCGLWYQLVDLGHHHMWLAPCEPYIRHGPEVCSIGLQYPVVISCIQGRIMRLKLWPIIKDSLGFPLLPNQTSAPAHCRGTSQGTLSPQLSALDQLESLYSFAPPRELYHADGSLDPTVIDCLSLTWEGDNITASIPQEWGHLDKLRALRFAGNRALAGHLPSSFLRVTENTAKIAYLAHTDVILPPMGGWTRHKLCRSCQKRNGSIFLVTDDRAMFFGLNLQRDMYLEEENARTFLIPALSSSKGWYCGRYNAGPQVASLWAVFLLLMALGTLIRVFKKHILRKGPGNNSSVVLRPTGGGGSSRMSLWWTRLHKLWHDRLHAPVFTVLTLNDLVADVFLAYSMFPSWTTWVILGGLMLPEVICVAAVTVQGTPILTQELGAILGPLVSPFFFMVTLLTFPLWLCYLALSQMVHQPGGQKDVGRGITRLWTMLDIHKLARLHFGVTACTEDVITMTFTSVGFMLMATAPFKVQRTNIYFTQLSFWVGMLTSMVHALLAWYTAVGHITDTRGFSWVGEAFTELYPTPTIPSTSPSVCLISTRCSAPLAVTNGLGSDEDAFVQV